MNVLLSRYHRFLFFSAWFLLNLWQSWSTGLFDDEAYYWLYAKYPAWGYFDHPPAIALLIKAGSALLPGETGLRLFIVLLNTASLLIIEKLLKPGQAKLFYAICLSMAVAQIGGIIAVPDQPLLFFVALFYYLYLKYRTAPSILHIVLLSVCIACMMYSKYHGVMVVVLTLIADPAQLKKPSAWLVAALSLLLFVPHIWWQYRHGFPSVQYHLFERNAQSYSIEFTLEYIVGQLIIAGPVIGWLLIWGACKVDTETPFNKIMKYNLAGLYIFFFISSFKGRVEANWTIPAFVPLIVLSHQYLRSHTRHRRWLMYSVPATLVLVAVGRFLMAVDMDADWIPKNEFQNNRQWTTEIKERANGVPVVFADSYQQPSQYWFYTGMLAFSLNTPSYRRNNFNFWPVEDSLQGKSVYFIAAYDSIQFPQRFRSSLLKQSGGQLIDGYYSFSRAKIEDIEQEKDSLHFTVSMPESYLNLTKKAPSDTAGLYLASIIEDIQPVYFFTGVRMRDLVSQNQRISIPLPRFWPKGKMRARLAIASRIPGKPSLNSTGFVITQ